MHTLKVLHNKLKQACPFIHLKRLAVLMLATQALLIGQRLSLTQLGRRLVSTALVKHNIKRIDRLLGNWHLHQERNSIYQFMSQALLKGNQRPLIIVDWSELTTDRDYHLLRASLPVGGRALTLYEEVHSMKKSIRKKISAARKCIRHSYAPCKNTYLIPVVQLLLPMLAFATPGSKWL
ncbi:MAG: hypothetical protein L3J98_06610 [Gammaproteobacteria bacterium]|nr:hypothetical protein [Gammaproteobacteria bacterium]